MACPSLPRWSLSWKVWSWELTERQEPTPRKRLGGCRAHMLEKMSAWPWLPSHLLDSRGQQERAAPPCDPRALGLGFRGQRHLRWGERACVTGPDKGWRGWHSRIFLSLRGLTGEQLQPQPEPGHRGRVHVAAVRSRTAADVLTSPGRVVRQVPVPHQRPGHTEDRRPRPTAPALSLIHI